jgi:ABC-2 type transport system ATP-binding protein
VKIKTALEVEALRKVYRSNKGDSVVALDGVSFQVPEGRVYGLLGPNGAGKSTLVKILSTITSPSSGRASVLGFDVMRTALEARRQMAVVLQQTAAETLLSVRDNLLIYAYLHGVRSKEAQARLCQVLEEFDLGARLRDTVQDLSIGTKRRIQVAKIFMVDSPVMILDEPTTGMDPLMKHRVLDRIRGETRAGRTVLLTTQVLSEAEQLCDRIIIIHRGKMLASGTLRELRKLAKQMLRVNLTFTEGADALIGRLNGLEPVEMRVDGSNVEMLFHGEEASLLAKLTEISRSTPIVQFEVRGPSLEEIFVALIRDAR